MKKAKLLAAGTLLLLTACSPKVVTHVIKTYPDPVSADSVYIFEPGDVVPNSAETLGNVAVLDRGTTTQCRYDQALRLAQEATGQIGGNGFAVVEHKEPSFWGSSCHQISGLMLRLSDKNVDKTQANPVQDMIDLTQTTIRMENERRQAPANTIEASIGYGWILSRVYDANGSVINSKGGMEWEIAYDHVWKIGMGFGLLYSGYRKSFVGGSSTTLSYIAPEFIYRVKFNNWIFKTGMGIGYFGQSDPQFNASGVGFHYALNAEYMLTKNMGLGLSMNLIRGMLPAPEGIELDENEGYGFGRINFLGGLRFYF